MAASAAVKSGKPVGQNGVPAGNATASSAGGTGDADDDDDDEEGRTAVVGKKGDLRKRAVDSARKRKATADIAEDDGIGPSGAGEIKGGDSEDTTAKHEGPLSRPAPGPRGRKKATSFWMRYSPIGRKRGRSDEVGCQEPPPILHLYNMIPCYPLEY